jgi:Plasmid pRiA4b ORF-3-like protein
MGWALESIRFRGDRFGSEIRSGKLPCMAQPPQPESIYQLRLVLSRVSPLIWRRFLVSSETSIAQLHEYIQIAFDWSGEHLHRFRIHGKDYGIAYLGGISFDDNPHRVPLSYFRLHLQEHFRYEYDFMAHWQVQIRWEKILPLDRHRAVPVCRGGRGAAPGEEQAGPLAYLQRLDRHRHEFPFEAMSTMAELMQAWLNSGGDRRAMGDLEELRDAIERVAVYHEFQPRRFDCREVNRKLRQASFVGNGVVA